MIATREHGSIGENVKVHFAGTENVDFARILNHAGVKYFLFTVLAYIKDRFAPQWGSFSCAKNLYAYQELPKIANHSIMDSGLFTLMFGACKNTRPDEKFIRSYKDAIVEFILEKSWTYPSPVLSVIVKNCSERILRGNCASKCEIKCPTPLSTYFIMKTANTVLIG